METSLSVSTARIEPQYCAESKGIYLKILIVHMSQFITSLNSETTEHFLIKSFTWRKIHICQYPDPQILKYILYNDYLKINK
jgi:hypothetical protein